MGYNISPNQKFTFQKGQFSHQWKYLIYTIMQCLSPKSTGYNEFSSNITTALVCLATKRTYNFSKIIFDGLVKNANNKDRATIDKSSTLPHDSAPRVTSSAAVEGTQEVEINRLKERVKQLEEREGVAAINFGYDAPIKERSMDEGEAATERVGDDIEEIATVLTLMDAATVLASGVVDVPTGSGSIPTASTLAEGSVPTGSDEVPTASPVFATATTSPVFSTATVVTPVTRRKDKEVMVESETLKKQKVQEQIDAQVARELEEQLEKEDQRRAKQIARDAEIVRIHAEEEVQSMIDGLDSNNETVAKYLEEYRQFSSELPMERRIELISDLVKDFRGMTFKEVEAKFNSVCKQMEDFIPMGSKEEAERIKRKGINLEQESAKKQKSSEEITEEAKSPEEVPKEVPEEVPEEKVREMMNMVPIEEVYVKLFKSNILSLTGRFIQRSYWKITRLGGNSACYQFFIDLLKHMNREDLNQLWRLVKETLSTRPPTSDKEMELWVELSKLYEPDKEDQLQRQRNLYACGEGLPSKEGSSTCDDLLQTSSGELLTDGK
uniref:Synaptobrevin, longin-like domain protein n=1 Tax=Tanacetum cinerariifolium TaxID=118510 RepID=A0A6L2M329_TANCI|nr:synaptobrevin, longin-like domain protein [Tanacetum cinerariifolium]